MRFKRINRLYKLTKYQFINYTKTQKAGNKTVPAFLYHIALCPNLRPFKIFDAVICNGDFLLGDCAVLFKLVNTLNNVIVLVNLLFKLFNAIV